MQILLVDDERRWVARAARVLGSIGHEVVHAASMPEASSLTQHTQLPIVFANAALAFQDKEPWLDQIACRHPSRIVILSDIHSDETAARAMRNRMQYARKPFSDVAIIKLAERVVVHFNSLTAANSCSVEAEK